MLRIATILVVVLALADTLQAQPPAAAAFKVIVHHDNPLTSVERRVASDMFLKRRTTWPDKEAVRPIDLASDSPLRARFSAVVLGKTIAQVRSYWQQRIFTGRELPPAEVQTEQDVVKFVTSYRGAIGYVSATADIGNAHVLELEER